jgi:ParB-like chromosome segregation protein Spo0J
MEITTPEKIEQIAVEDLLPYKNNSRKHSNEQIVKLAQSLKEFGFTNPVLISLKNEVIAGHGRIEAAKRVGMTKVPCIRLEHLDDAQRRALIIADNQHAMLASWDYDILAHEIDELNSEKYDISVIGFTNEELADLIGSPEEFPDNDLKADEKTKKPVECPNCGWVISNPEK